MTGEKRLPEGVVIAWSKPWREQWPAALTALRHSLWSAPLVMLVCYLFWLGLFWLVRWAVPAASDEPLLDKVFVMGAWVILAGGCAVIFLVPVSMLVPSSYAIMERGVRICDRVYLWRFIRGYYTEALPQPDNRQLLCLVLGKNRTRKLEIPPEVPFDEIESLVAEHVPRVSQSDVMIYVYPQVNMYAALVVTVVYAVLLGWLVGTYCTSKNLLAAILVFSFFAGPGTMWILLRHWAQLQKKTDALGLGMAYNMLGTVLIMGISMVFMLRRIMSE